MNKCKTCKLNKIVSGCGKSIKDMEIVKGIGVVECKHYEKEELAVRPYTAKVMR